MLMECRLMDAAWHQQAENLFRRVYLDTFGNPMPEFDAVIAGETIYLMTEGTQVVGMATVWEPDAFIHFLMVSPEYRRKGVGTRMAEELSKRYDQPLTLKCFTINERALQFYEKTGWQAVSEGTGDDGEYVVLEYRNNNGEED